MTCRCDHLNRAHRQRHEGFVLDCQNGTDMIQEAVADYYGYALLNSGITSAPAFRESR
jgi:hypothetical protein